MYEIVSLCDESKHSVNLLINRFKIINDYFKVISNRFKATKSNHFKVIIGHFKIICKHFKVISDRLIQLGGFETRDHLQCSSQHV